MYVKARGPGGGKLVRKRVERKWLYDVIIRQQDQLNSMAKILLETQELNTRLMASQPQEPVATVNPLPNL